MQLVDFDYYLPEELIAQQPTVQREQSRLLVVDDLNLSDHYFSDISRFIAPNDLLVLNDTLVIKSRLYGHKITGGKIEILVEQVIGEDSLLAHIRSNKKINVGLAIIFPANILMVVTQIVDGLFKLKIVNDSQFAAQVMAKVNANANPSNSVYQAGQLDKSLSAYLLNNYYINLLTCNLL